MNKTPNDIKFLIIGFCTLIFLVLNFGYGVNVQTYVTNALFQLTSYYFAISIHKLDFLLLASIPFFGLIYNATRTKFKKLELIIDMVTVLLYVFVIFGIGLFLMTYIGRNSNPLVPQYLLTEPFYLYTTLLIGIGISIPFLILKLIKK